jgi:hypothetical protein
MTRYLSVFFFTVLVTVAITPKLARGGDTAEIAGLRKEVSELRNQVHRLQLGALATQLDYLRRAVIASKLPDEEKRNDNEFIQGIIEKLRKTTPPKPEDLKRVSDIVHATSKARMGGKDLDQCLKNCDDEYNSRMETCNGIADGFERAYCQTQAIETWHSCQEDCRNNN